MFEQCYFTLLTSALKRSKSRDQIHKALLSYFNITPDCVGYNLIVTLPKDAVTCCPSSFFVCLYGTWTTKRSWRDSVNCFSFFFILDALKVHLCNLWLSLFVVVIGVISYQTTFRMVHHINKIWGEHSLLALHKNILLWPFYCRSERVKGDKILNFKFTTFMQCWSTAYLHVTTTIRSS